MRKLCVVLSLVLLACTAMATGDPNPDGIGIYFDTDGDVYCTTSAVPFANVVAYLLATNSTSSSGISGWEARLWTAGSDPVAPAWTLAAGLDVDPSPDGFQVGIGTSLPLPHAPTIVLATWSGFIMNPTDQVEFFISGIPGSTSFPDSPGYATGSNAGDLREFQVSSGTGFNLPVAGINTCPFIFPPPPPSFEFTLDITASNSTLTDSDNRLGTRDEASDGYDILDLPTPPLSPADYLSFDFIHPEWSSPFGDNFNHDIREVYNYTTGNRVWVIRTETDHVGELVELDFEMMANYSYTLILRDHESGNMVNLVASGYAYSYTPNPDGVNGFDIIVGNPTPPELSPVSRQLEPGWSLIGAPLIPTTNNFDSVILNDATGTTYAMDHNPATGYEVQSGYNPVEQSRGYWLGTDSAFTWDMDGSRDLNEIHFPLHEGWNLVGYPLWFPSHVNGIAINRAGAEISWGDAVSAGVIDGQLLTWNGTSGSYTSTLEINAWNGYWLACYEPDIELIFHYENMPQSTQLRWEPFAKLDDEENWKLDISLLGTSHRIILGTCIRSTDGFDAYLDRPSSPRAPNTQIEPELVFDHPEWNLSTGSKLRQDIRSPLSVDPYTWSTVLTSPEPGDITLDWSRSAWGGSQDLQVYLPEQNRVVVASMRSTGRVTLTVGEEPLVVHFRTPSATTGVDDVRVFASSVDAVPNPFNPQTEIRYTSASAGACEVRIFDLAGRLVRTLAGEDLLAGGMGSVTWHGRDESGREVASGTYFARLMVDHRPDGVIRKLSLIR